MPCLEACSSPLSSGAFVTVTPPYLMKRWMHGVLQHLLTVYGLILWNIIHHDELHSPTRSNSTLAVPTSCPNTSTETLVANQKETPVKPLSHDLWPHLNSKECFCLRKDWMLLQQRKKKRMGRHYHYHFLNRLFYYCFQSWRLVFNIFLSILLGIWFATILP